MSSPNPRPRPASAKTKRYLVAVGLLAGGVTAGALLSPVSLAGAQDGSSTTQQLDSEAVDSSADTADGTDGKDGRGHGHHHHGRRQALLDEMAAIIGIDADELEAQLADGQTPAEVAEGNGSSADELVAGLLAELEERLDEAVADGRIDQATADERLAQAPEKLEELVDTVPSERGHRHPRLVAIGEAIEQLGLDTEAVRQAIADGHTLAEAAAEGGVSEAELVDTLEAMAVERIDEAVANGRLTEEEAEERKAGLEERITEMVTTAPGERGRHHLGHHANGVPHHHGGHHHGRGGGGDGAADSDAETT